MGDSSEPGPAGRTLTDEEQATLLRLARDSLSGWLGQPTSGLAEGLEPLPAALDERQGAFVTLHVDGQLRGCIGSVRPTVALGRLVAELAVAAASRDYRFPRLEAAELDRLEIEISVLSPPAPIRSPDEIEVGRHGLIVARGPHVGLLLPQVAVHQQWDTPTFLGHTCEKAGLPADSWQEWAGGRDPDLSVEAFTAQVFSEAAAE
jgi:AmmeMemoRadiSam system protein A